MKIISNTGPIIGLAKIDRLFILKNIASEVVIPPMVYLFIYIIRVVE